MLLKSDSRDQEWVRAFFEVMPDLQVRVWPDIGDPSEINCALLWGPPPGLFEGLDSLEVIFSIGAGVDSLLDCPGLPVTVPIIRMVEPELTAGMVEFCLFHVLRFHRLMHRYQHQQTERHWQDLPQVPARETTVGIMGMGVLGSALVKQLHSLDYRVIGYRRQEGGDGTVEMFHGEAQFEAFMRQTTILVLLLPATAQTRHIINQDTLGLLSPGGYLINAGRGELVDEGDLLSALQSGWLQGAALDVFETEPLPQESPLWSHPNVFLTPHVASITHPASACRYIAEAIQDYRSGKTWPYQVRLNQGY